MADIGNGLKSVFMKSMEAISNTASNIAVNTKYKVDEMNLLNRRHEIVSDFGAKAYRIWQKGEEHFPEELEIMLRELSEIDEKMNSIRAERVMSVSSVKTPVKQEEEEAENADPAEETNDTDAEMETITETETNENEEPAGEE